MAVGFGWRLIISLCFLLATRNRVATIALSALECLRILVNLVGNIKDGESLITISYLNDNFLIDIQKNISMSRYLKQVNQESVW